jgi:hypothetical protein
MPEVVGHTFSAFYDYEDLSEPGVSTPGQMNITDSSGSADVITTSERPSGALIGEYAFDLLEKEVPYPLQDTLPMEQNVSTFTGEHQLIVSMMHLQAHVRGTTKTNMYLTVVQDAFYMQEDVLTCT